MINKRPLSYILFVVLLLCFLFIFAQISFVQAACVCVCSNNTTDNTSFTNASQCDQYCSAFKQCPPPNGACVVDIAKSTCDDVSTTPGGGGGADQAEIYEKQGVWFPKDPLDISGNIKDKPKTILKNTILLVLKFAGAGAFLLSLYAGFIIMFARGEAKKVAEGKKIIVYAVVGLIVILLSYLMLNLIFSVLQKAVT